MICIVFLFDNRCKVPLCIILYALDFRIYTMYYIILYM